MSKLHWGIKRVCNNGSCGAKFYDFQEKVIVCPSCGCGYSQKLSSRSYTDDRAPMPMPVPTPEPASVSASVDGEIVLDDAEDLPSEGVPPISGVDSLDLAEDDIS